MLRFNPDSWVNHSGACVREYIKLMFCWANAQYQQAVLIHVHY